METHVDEFETLFSQLERMHENTKFPDCHKDPILLESMGYDSDPDSTVCTS